MLFVSCQELGRVTNKTVLAIFDLLADAVMVSGLSSDMCCATDPVWATFNVAQSIG